ncbi:hypothetical protein AYO20_01822 [Fonsecaea nubica]|uniref:GAT domain-containing protein n=1 Tax=Fonsecaea nubica TaxID=856822 RepID=A0A178DCY4_9EURO|nr:hypothetical protein AYO20_01822 [Fonsecaea nubica]OAL39071.1 hypothetical protein AYO20_01822 [Fonsecaea nubica]
MKKFLGNIKKKSSSPERNGSSTFVLPQGDSPEAVVVREVTAFCESGAPNSDAAGEEYLHLPAIVDAAESSPTAAKEAAATIRRYLSKENYQKGYAQYNAVMLSRILTDNPARAFTQNFDHKFVATVKELLREGKDTSVQQILRETLDYFEVEKAPGNDSLGPLMEMWRKEKGKRNALRPPQAQIPGAYAGHYPQQQHRRRDTLPPAEELAGRIEEAKTTARLLVQTVQSTPQAELLANDLVKEFADRAKTMQRSIQSYLNAQNPAPDPDTMLTLIETNDLLNIAMSKHQRAVLQARKATGLATPSPQAQTEPQQNPMFTPQQHVPGQNVYSQTSQPQSVPPEHGPYSSSPPRRQNTIPTPVSPLRREEEELYAPPPGPPPSKMGAPQIPPPQTSQNPYDFSNAAALSSAFAAPEQPPPVPTRVRPQSHAYSSSADYGVADNPFDDDAYGSPQPQARSNALFDRNQNTPSPHLPQQYATNQYPQELPSDQQRPGPYNAGYQPTPSYVHRQESSAEHLTMHGGGPTTGATAPNGGSSYPTSGPFGSNPVSPIDETQGVGRRMNDLHI